MSRQYTERRHRFHFRNGTFLKNNRSFNCWRMAIVLGGFCDRRGCVFPLWSIRYHAERGSELGPVREAHEVILPHPLIHLLLRFRQFFRRFRQLEIKHFHRCHGPILNHFRPFGYPTDFSFQAGDLIIDIAKSILTDIAVPAHLFLILAIISDAEHEESQGDSQGDP